MKLSILTNDFATFGCAYLCMEKNYYLLKIYLTKNRLCVIIITKSNKFSFLRKMMCFSVVVQPNAETMGLIVFWRRFDFEIKGK